MREIGSTFCHAKFIKWRNFKAFSSLKKSIFPPVFGRNKTRHCAPKKNFRNSNRPPRKETSLFVCLSLPCNRRNLFDVSCPSHISKGPISEKRNAICLGIES
ncbi:hypothetical protein F0562_021758 [Nyssa sinensis]|uniref:Uncharacterized protein n=1 Tax=Nyssa sinensis TaxID=561372 RepID=A0A5J5BLR0_9ASTE|nr:hypothetical protein F0562_021758 [Nyssa sinensis]